MAAPLADAHREIAPDEAGLRLRYSSNVEPGPGESHEAALRRRLRETADKEIWNGATLVGPHRDDFVFESGGRELTEFASRGQQRTAILALKLAELDLLTHARRSAAAAPARRRLQRARPRASGAPGAPHRRAAPGHRDHHHARRPRPGPGGRVHAVARRARQRRSRAHGRPGVSGPQAAGPSPRRPAAGHRPQLGLDEELRGRPRPCPRGSASSRSRCRPRRRLAAARGAPAGAGRLGRRCAHRPGAAAALGGAARGFRLGAGWPAPARAACRGPPAAQRGIRRKPR